MDVLSDKQPLQLNNALWEYACSRYTHPELRDLCLHLQESRGADVNLLLAAGWTALNGMRMSVQQVHNHVSEWRHRIILPIRLCRQSLNKQICLERKLRSTALRLEILAEQVELAQIYRHVTEHCRLVPISEASPPSEKLDIVTICNQNLLDTLLCEGHAHPVIDSEIERLSFLLLNNETPASDV